MGTPALKHLVLTLAHERRGGAEIVRGEVDSCDLGVDAVRITDPEEFLQQVTELRQRAGYSDKFSVRMWVRRHFRVVKGLAGNRYTMQGMVMVSHAAAHTCHRRWGVQNDSQDEKRQKWRRVEWMPREC